MTPDLLNETNYQQQMHTLAEPYLEQCRSEHFIRQSIFEVSYLTDTSKPKGIILISHGFTENAEKYREAAYYFLHAGYHVSIPEHCGHGRSYRLHEDPSLVHINRYEQYIEDLLSVAHTISQRHPRLPIYVYAHSMGGGIAAAAAASAPSLFSGIILSSPMLQPSAGSVPWTAVRFISHLLCLMGLSKAYVPGHHPFDGNERFEDSAACSEPRFLYNAHIRLNEPLFQTNAASCGWLYQCVRLNRFLLKQAPEKIAAPLLLFQAEHDTYVSAKSQERFIRKLKNTHSNVQLVRIADSKHEIYNSCNSVLAVYWKQIFEFLDKADAITE